jgi:predicted alpha/beta superfamily hydrolase
MSLSHPSLRSVLLALVALTLSASTALGGCASSTPADPVPPHDALAVESTTLGETRAINVYTPPGYEAGDRQYPVLYMPDGGVGEDFPHIANTIDTLIQRGAIAPVLVVGIENTERGRDLTPASQTEYDGQFAPMTDGASAFRAFIRDELVPEIDRRYRTNGGRAIVGESSAGLFVVDTFFREPALFDRYIAMDPALWWDDHALVQRAGERLPGLAGDSLTLWFAGSNAEDIAPHTDSLATALEGAAPADLRWRYEPRRDEEHRTIFRATKAEAFEWALWPSE